MISRPAPLLRAGALFLALSGLLAPALRADGLGEATPNEILVQAQTVIARSDYTLAKKLLDNLIVAPNVDRAALAEAVFLRGRVSEATEQYTDAVIWFQRYLLEFPDQNDAPRASFELGQTYKQLGAYSQARETFYKTLSFAISRAANQNVDDFSGSVRLSRAATWELAETEYLAANWERADELYTRFKLQNPDAEKLNQTACYRQADIAFQMKKPKEAVALYETALAASPFHPFATEAWLRLVLLYGMTGQKDKQTAATKSFIWMVNTLEKDDQLYWQRRFADQLLSQYSNHLAGQIPVLETIFTYQNNEGWMRMLDFYLGLLARQQGDPNADVPQPSAASGDDWNDWLRGFHERLGGIVQKMEAMRDTDTPAAARASATAVQPVVLKAQ